MAVAGSSRGPPKRPPEDKLFCPRQDNIEDIHICEYDIARGVGGYVSMLNSMRIRQENLAPFTVGPSKRPGIQFIFLV
ncbi:hypothetical protein E2562_004986 [Oryza meyeriana var. granulata]|uniref:Uncharacterized protein n=1 Tax=Oryza meyeriana var. granulata TaxID=110450 RepID=A0A6G1C434_9ORYZ|nr:hypothetical protein E2562_004986 [Oryza meyeriana var. granulata]